MSSRKYINFSPILRAFCEISVENIVEKMWIKMWKIGQRFQRQKLKVFGLERALRYACGKEKFSRRKKNFRKRKKIEKGARYERKKENISVLARGIFPILLKAFRKIMLFSLFIRGVTCQLT